MNKNLDYTNIIYSRVKTRYYTNLIIKNVIFSILQIRHSVTHTILAAAIHQPHILHTLLIRPTYLLNYIWSVRVGFGKYRYNIDTYSSTIQYNILLSFIILLNIVVLTARSLQVQCTARTNHRTFFHRVLH